MTKSKKLSIFIFSLLLVLTSFLFVACSQPDYSKTKLSAETTYIEVYKGADNARQISVTIENPVENMSNEIRKENSDESVCSVEDPVVVDYTSTFKITGLNGGQSVITFTTRDGSKKFELTVKVREYAELLTKGENSIYISSSTQLIPSSADFSFHSSVTERELEYYFYGKTAEKNSITKADIEDEIIKNNKFVKAKLVHITENDKDYLIFEDASKNLFTLGSKIPVSGTENFKYEFIPVTQEFDSYIFDFDAATSVSAGEKFSFIAKYQGESADKIFVCEREFHVLIDIDATNFSHEFGYKLQGVDYIPGESLTSYKIEGIKSDEISLITDYKTIITDQPLLVGKTAVYASVYLEVTARSANELLIISVESEDKSALNSKLLKDTSNGDSKTYYIEINCQTEKATNTNYIITFYYKGFENSDDEKVNYSFSIPVNIKAIPTNLLINNVREEEEDNIYRFYNNYASSMIGWQTFNFAVIPEGADYDSLKIDLTNSGLQLRYKNTIYTSGIVEIADIYETVYIRGVDGAEPTTQTRQLPVTVEFDVIKPDQKNSYIKYEIVKGAEVLTFKTEEFKEHIYLDINGGKLNFSDIYADAEFTGMAFSHVSGKENLVRFEFDRDNLYTKQGNDYILNFQLTPLAIGTGSYTITLDNGKIITINITVLEALNEIMVSTTNEDNVVTLFEEEISGGNKSTLVYALNKKENSYFDVRVFANDNPNTVAIKNVTPKSNSHNIELASTTVNGQRFNVYLKHNGSSQLVLSVEGYKINNFKRESIVIDYPIDIVAYSLIEKLNVYKESDGFGDYSGNALASYVNVYSNTSNSSVREAVLSVGVKNAQGFLFENPSLDSFSASVFSEEFVYWESDATIYKNDVETDKMYYKEGDTNVYTVGNYGTFDTKNLKFTAFPNIQSERSLRLIAHVRQYRNLYSFSVNFKISVYEEVERISLQTIVDELEFSALEREHEIIAWPTNATATNGEIVAIFQRGTIQVGNNTYSILDKNSISYLESDGKTQIKLKLSEEFLLNSVDYTDVMQGDLLIVAKDWLDVSGNLKGAYQDKVDPIIVRFANGTKNNRFTIKDKDDLLAIKDNLSAHYRIKTTIDASSIAHNFPLGELKGSIVGVNEYAIISGINLTSKTEGLSNFGLFSTIAPEAYIEYIQFEGSFNIGGLGNPYSGLINIGLVAGENYGRLINIGATISTSNIYMTQGSFGGFVGRNRGSIIQDFTLFEKSKFIYDEETGELIEEIESNSKSFTKAELMAEGRYSYQGFTPKTAVYMNNYVNISYIVGALPSSITQMGGMVGENAGIIQKIDSSKINTSGYTNYLAYSKIKSIPSNLSIITNITKVYLGGLVGENANNGKVVGGYNAIENDDAVFKTYNDYIHKVDDENVGNFQAGKGIVVGGEVLGYGFVGGVVGHINKLSTWENFSGITARTSVRGQKAGNTIANIALIANIESVEESQTLKNAFAIQAVDDAKMSIDASMAVLYNGAKIDAYDDVNKLGFGNFDNKIAVLKGYDGDGETGIINVLTYVISREKIIKSQDEEKLFIRNISKDAYYGDFIVLGDFEGSQIIVDQKFFVKGNQQDLSLLPKFANKMQSQTGGREVYFAYYYQAASAAGGDIAQIQSQLDLYLNKISAENSFYPFIPNGEMIFTSRNSDILTIDQMGKITIKKTGLAQISATSILNSNDALNFYIYVVNYFNSEYLIEDNSLKSSIVYPNLSQGAVAYNSATINLRGESSATLYLKPNYFADQTIESDRTINFSSDYLGNANLGGLAFSLAGNDKISAIVEEIEKGENGEIIVKTTNDLNIEVVGQVITIRKLESTAENKYFLRITPQLRLDFETNGTINSYYNNVNKVITDIAVDYKYGALYISNKNYNEVPIYTSDSIVEKITIGSTDIDENAPKYFMLGLDNLPLQDYTSGEGQLFNISITKAGDPVDIGLGRYEHNFILRISVNTSSILYENRYNQNIYGRYALYVEADSNSGKNILIQIDFEKTNVFSVIIDNYAILNDASHDNGLTSSSENAYPGESGLLAITITPEDSDFDYILIENDDQNYEAGHSSAVLGLLARNDSPTGESGLFKEGKISGSTTKKGLKITLDEIVKLYGKDEFVSYNGVVYVKYNMSSYNVVDGSKSKLNVKLFKDGNVVNNGDVNIELTIKLKNYVAVEIEGKDGQANQGEYYMTYDVARGLRYKLNINSYGYKLDNALIAVSNPNLGTIVETNGEYYLDITSAAINYSNDANIFEINISVSQTEGDIVRTSSSKTKIIINEYVFNYNGEEINDDDIVKGMGDGIINVQVGSQITFELDLFKYVEYDEKNVEVINKIYSFFESLAQKGNWCAYTNLITNDQPNYEMANGDNGKEFQLGYSEGIAIKENNYYFNSNGLNLIPVRTHLPEEKYYYFTYNGYFALSNGVYTCVASADAAQEIKTTLILNVYSASSEESPIPIYDYEDLSTMQKGGYYILLNDITIPNEAGEDGVSLFKPINANFASFDGNGHTINMGGTYNMGNLSNFGLFGSVAQGTIIKNLILNLTSSPEGNDLNTDSGDTTYALQGLRIIRFITTSESFTFGAIASENEGIITNCQVKTDIVSGNEYYLTVKADNALRNVSYIGGVAGVNSGYITNCGVSINVKAPFNIGGVVGQNFNKISGCYFKEGKLINNSQFDQHIAGFAISNSSDAQISESFVAGKQTNMSLVTKDKNSFIDSTLASAGFIYENRGLIRDCYTDIDLSQTKNEMAGFVYRNSGTIKNSFSLSELRNNVTASAGFAKENIVEGIPGKFSNCYYYYHKAQGENDRDINTSLYNVTIEGIQALNDEQFNEIETYFADYSYQDSIGAEAIWFHSKGNTSTTFIDYIPTTEKIVIDGKEGNSQTNTVYKTQLMVFGINRLELVNPNIKVLSIRNFDYSEYDEATGNVTYHYLDDANAPNKGSLHNPRLISNADNMESEILEQTSSNNINLTHYRIVSDIEYEGYSNLYKVIFAGSLEGNGMEISQINLASMEKHESAGMFAQIGYSSSSRGIVKNLTISPREVSFNNTNNVGTLAGVLNYGNIYNIKVNAVRGGSETVKGLNFVGGVIGRAVSSYIIKDVYSYANASASHSSGDVSYKENSGAISSFSYAGGIVGFAGNGNIYNAHASSISSVMGSRAGLAYGGVGEGAKIKYTFVDIAASTKIKAYHYGGFIAGEVAGELSHSYVPSNKNIESPFASIPKVPKAVGGIAGKLIGGTISDALVEQSFRATSTESSTAIAAAGGIVGLVSGEQFISKITNSKVTGEISGSNVLGGAVGDVATALEMQGIAIRSNTLSVVGERADPKLGGIVGCVSQSRASLTLKDSYCISNLEITTNTSGVASTAQAGGLIGSSARKPKLEYCYTTSIITAKVYDSRQLGNAADFGDYNAVGEVAPSFSYNITKDASFNNVYYLGGNAKTAGLSDQEYYKTLKNFISFSTKSKNVEIGLVVNNFGQSSIDYSSIKLKDSALSSQESAFYNLYGNDYNANVGSEILNIVYNHANNTYLSDVNAWLNNGEGVRFVEDINNVGEYYYEKSITSEDQFKLYDNNDIINAKFVGGGTEYQYVETTVSGAVKKALYDVKNKMYYYDDGAGGFKNELNMPLDLSALTLRVTLKADKLLQKKVLKDSKDDYFEFGLFKYEESGSATRVVEGYKNIIEDEIYYLIDSVNKVYKTASGEVLAEMPKEIWVINGNLSTLAFEDSFTWISRL